MGGGEELKEVFEIRDNITYLYSRAQSLANNNPAFWINPHTSWALKLAIPFSFTTKLEHKPALGVEHLNAVIMAVGNNYSTLVVYGHTKYAIEFANVGPFSAEFHERVWSTSNVDFEGTSLNVFVTHGNGHLC